MGTGSDTRERDKKAMIVCAYNYQEFQGIVNAHLLLNGAYYKRAKEELEVIDLSKLSGSYFETEYYYLLGCSLMGSNKLNEAIQNFSKAIDTAFDTNHFLLKPAMQKQALAYEKMMRFNDALKKYKETLNSKSENNSFSKHAEKEAQDGLKRIKNH
jgi:tetratricopeptide (TPR) repeat protein